MIILGIDPGLARVGYGVIEVEERPPWRPGAPPGQQGRQRLLD